MMRHFLLYTNNLKNALKNLLRNILADIRDQAGSWQWWHRVISQVIFVFALLIFLLDGQISSAYFISEIILLIVLLQLFLVPIGVRIYKEGWRSIAFRAVWQSVRVKMTIWYAIILAIVLFVFNSLVTHTIQFEYISSLDTSLQNRIVSVANTYNPQSNKLATGTIADPGYQEIVLLLTPQGQVMQSSPAFHATDRDASKFLNNMQSSCIFRDQVTLTLAVRCAIVKPMPGEPAASAASFSNGLRLASIKNTRLSIYDLNQETFFTLSGHDYRFQVVSIADNQGNVVALLAIGEYSDMYTWLNKLDRVQSLAVPLTVLLASMSSSWLVGRTMRPVRKITHTVQQIGETDLHRRLNLQEKDELGELASTFDQMLDRLEAAFDRQRQFTADASHELRTPLSIINLEATRALDRDYTPQQYWQAMKIIQQENEHMARLVNDLLTLARGDSRQRSAYYEEVDLSDLTIDMAERLESLAVQTSIPIQVSPPTELLVKGDASALGRMISNIIENALKYSAGSGTHIEICLTECVLHDQHWARLTVIDDGPGIEAKHLPHIFERFYRVDASRTHTTHDRNVSIASNVSGQDRPRQAGSGLGLAIAQWIAQSHGGEILVESQPGVGTIFEVWLPLIA